MTVDLNSAWTGNADYPTNGHTHAAAAGDNRVGIVTISHEMNGGGGIGTDGSCVVTWGGQVCAEGEMDWCGDPAAYHDMAFIGYLTEAQVALMTDGIVDSVVITNGNGGVGPFGNSKIKTAFYENVDQANIISAASKASTSRSAGTTATNLTMGTLDTDVDEQVIMHFTSGQGATNGDDSFVSETGWTEEVDHVGDETNDHASSAVTRDSQANDDTLAVNFNCNSANRLCIVCVSLGAAATSGAINNRTLTDTMVLTDPTDAKQRFRDRDLSDALAVDYSLETIRKRVVSMLNNVTALTDSLTAVKSKAPASFVGFDEFGVTDDHTELRLRFRALSDALELVDAAIALRERNRVLPDTLALVDSLTGAKLTAPTLVTTFDELDVTDNREELRLRFRVLIDNIELTDLALIPGIVTILLDSIELADTMVELRERYRVMTDALVVTDLLLIPTIGTILQDSLDLADATVELRLRFRVLQDSIALTDNAIAQYVAGDVLIISRTLSDAFELADAAQALRERYRVLAEGFAVNDAEDIQRYRNRINQELLEVTDNVIPLTERIRSMSDNIVVPDASVELRQRNRTLLDAIAVVDTVISISTGTIVRTLLSVLAVTDATVALRERDRVQSDTLDSTDTLLRSRLTPGQLTDSIDLADSTSLFYARGRVYTDNAVLTDIAIATYVKEGITIRQRILMDQLAVIDLSDIEKIFGMTNFAIEHFVEPLGIDHSVENLEIVHRIRNTT